MDQTTQPTPRPFVAGVERTRRRARALSQRQRALRGVIESAHEVRIDFTDRRVLFAHVLADAELSSDEGGKPTIESFAVRPWGWSSRLDVHFDAVVRATPVRRMDWATQRRISAEQLASGVVSPSTCAM